MIDERDIKSQVFNYLNTDTKYNNTIDTVKWGKDIEIIWEKDTLEYTWAFLTCESISSDLFSVKFDKNLKKFSMKVIGED